MVAEEPPQDVGQYDQTSIRYTGKNIPSRSFRMLQHLTGGDPGTPPGECIDNETCVYKYIAIFNNYRFHLFLLFSKPRISEYGSNN